MKVVQLNSWHVQKNDAGVTVYMMFRHDGSILEVPLSKDAKPLGVPEIQYLVVDGPYVGFTGFMHKGWVPQPLA